MTVSHHWFWKQLSILLVIALLISLSGCLRPGPPPASTAEVDSGYATPTLIITLESNEQGGSTRTVQLSTEPLGTGIMEIQTPLTMTVGTSYEFLLILDIGKTLSDYNIESSESESLHFTDQRRLIGELPIYPVMIAELDGNNFTIEAQRGAQQPVSAATTWYWNVVPLQVGQNKLRLNIATPALNDLQQVLPFTLREVALDIQVQSPVKVIESDDLESGPSNNFPIMLVGVPLIAIIIGMGYWFYRRKEIPESKQTFYNKSYQEKLVRFHSLLVEHFNEVELRDLCFKLGVNYEDLGGRGRSENARLLIEYCERHRRIRDLLTLCKQLRPNVVWELEIRNPLDEA